MDGMTGIVKGGLTPKMILDDVSFNFRTPIHSSPLTADESFVDQLLHFNNIDPFQPPLFQQQQQQQQQQQPEPEPEPVKHEREPEKKRTRSGRRVRATSHSDSSPPSKNPVRKGSHKGEQKTCSHCGTQKTPQWRGGPKGPKTLCNACGVRFKKGRLLPEYRPASSPSDSRELHSNSHRKVMEMRMVKNKEEAGP